MKKKSPVSQNGPVTSGEARARLRKAAATGSGTDGGTTSAGFGSSRGKEEYAEVMVPLAALGNEGCEWGFPDHHPRQHALPRPVSSLVLQSNLSAPENQPVRGQFRWSPDSAPP